MKDGRSFAYILGQALGALIITCLAACIGGVLVSLTAKFLIWLF